MGVPTQSERDALTCCRGARREMKGMDGERAWGRTGRTAVKLRSYLGQVEERRGTLEGVRQHPGAGEQQTAGVGHGAQRGVTGRLAHLAGRSSRSSVSLSSGSRSLSLFLPPLGSLPPLAFQIPSFCCLLCAY